MIGLSGCIPERVPALHEGHHVDFSAKASSSFFVSTSYSGFAHGTLEFCSTPDPAVYRVDISVTNNSPHPIDFAQAQYYAFTEQGNAYYFDFEKVAYNDAEGKGPLLLPSHTIQIYCRTACNPAYARIKAVYLRLRDGRFLKFLPEK